MTKCKICKKEIEEQGKWLKIPELGMEVEIDLHTDMNTTSKIVIPKNCKVLTLSEWLVCYNKYKDKINWGGLPDEIVLQPIKENKDKYPYWNVWFRCLVGWSDFCGGNWGLGYDFGVRGVRFKRTLKKVKK